MAEPEVRLPTVYIEPLAVADEGEDRPSRAEPATLGVESRRKNFAEVEMALSAEQARAEARRCLRCDLAFTQCLVEQPAGAGAEGRSE